MTDRSKTLEVMARAICGPPGAPCEACRLSAKRALTALQAEGMAVVPGWQPIESAPKDGTEVVGCYFKDWGGGTVSRYGPWTIAWDGHRWRSSWDGSRVVDYMGDFGTDYKEPDCDPSHWMPLPAPPTNSTKEESDE